MKKAPLAPKRAKSPYICFSMAKRAEVKEQMEGSAKVTDIMTKLAEEWQKLSEEDRVPWVEKANEDKARCVLLTVMIAFVTRHLLAQIRKRDGPIRRASTS
jgi:hypothetical protein